MAGDIERLRAEVAALDRYLNARIDSQAEKVALALAASDRAINKAETAYDKRFESVNEFRLTLSDQTKTLVPRTEFDQLAKSLTEKIDDLKNIEALTAGRSAGIRLTTGALFAGLAALATVLTIVFMLLQGG